MIEFLQLMPIKLTSTTSAIPYRPLVVCRFRLFCVRQRYRSRRQHLVQDRLTCVRNYMALRKTFTCILLRRISYWIYACNPAPAGAKGILRGQVCMHWPDNHRHLSDHPSGSCSLISTIHPVRSVDPTAASAFMLISADSVVGTVPDGSA